jgi:hypothetical protein
MPGSGFCKRRHANRAPFNKANQLSWQICRRLREDDRLDEGMLALVDNGVVGVDVSLLLQDVKAFLYGLLVAVEHRLVLLHIEEGEGQSIGHGHVMVRVTVM